MARSLQVDLHQPIFAGHTEVSLAGLILAAGASRRMGAPKALLEVQGETFLDRLIGLFSFHCSPVLVVLGHNAETVKAGLHRASDASFVVNPDPEKGQLSSLKCGLRVIPPDVEGVIFTPVDYPKIESSTIEALATAFRREAGRSPVIIPRHQGRHGHPVCVARELIPEFLALGEDSQAREVIHRNSNRTYYVEVGDPWILVDVDDREAYQQLIDPKANS
jgi:molybdenum cofactor cytidylyltransferase